jgi:hypothetical protein
MPDDCRWLACLILVTTSCAEHATLELGQPSGAAGPAPGAVPEGTVSLRPLAPDGRVELPAQSEIEFADHFTLEAWIFPHDSKGGSLFCKTGESENKQLELLPGELRVLAPLALGSELVKVSLETSRGLSTLDWHHVALSYERSSLGLFLDGALAASSTLMDPVADGSAIATWGSCIDSPEDPADASVSDLRFSRVGRYLAPFVPEPELLVDEATSALFHLREGRSGPASDSGPHQVAATIEGAVQWPRLPHRR